MHPTDSTLSPRLNSRFRAQLLLRSVLLTAKHNTELDLPAQGSAVKSRQQLSEAFNKRYEFESMSELRAP
ncbi:hypothetical protein CWC12_18585 [Pseudoalteromonas ruthenica]|uniref:Uncharacterized protein n=1 Tax=Pseudoalteromonas ruthenica TaxID=151081 RepID=A0A0F4PJS7_9GAMM|nr:hypothetical protein TW76_18245 [Pseudoalteromonas ruthenica]KJY95518.1 hypothetical protein TW72_18010 [Pseudoalteromonas ruthenica]TMO84509.1 hypothetical protein CWC12_18585 [Pseudoalteromonas ruthenica]TMO92378.1 hypothetical protein CWC13_10970 [Pseudoalteromonas ruthenica]TMP04358.1 hypothetical protein CWC08_18195 [Pseudoalteromonas ruthenica]